MTGPLSWMWPLAGLGLITSSPWWVPTGTWRSASQRQETRKPSPKRKINSWIDLKSRHEETQGFIYPDRQQRNHVLEVPELRRSRMEKRFGKFPEPVMDQESEQYPALAREADRWGKVRPAICKVICAVH